MKENRILISKLDSARRQLETAIKLFFAMATSFQFMRYLMLLTQPMSVFKIWYLVHHPKSLAKADIKKQPPESELKRLSEMDKGLFTRMCRRRYCSKEIFSNKNLTTLPPALWAREFVRAELGVGPRMKDATIGGGRKRGCNSPLRREIADASGCNFRERRGIRSWWKLSRRVC